MKAIEAGVHKIRVNPGNLRGGEEAVRAIARAAGNRGIPVRVGANSGSLPKEAAGEERGHALARAVIEECRMFERAGLRDIVVSAKGSDVVSTVAAGRLLAAETDYPIHVGLTAAGPSDLARTKSAAALGALLADGIGDTIRVSYTGPPHEEVLAAHEILEALLLERTRPEIVSCPTCGRTRVDLVRIVAEVREALKGCREPIRVAVMGCEVNGPGEAADADVGLACFEGGGFLFSGGRKIARVGADRMVAELVALVREAATGQVACKSGRDRHAAPEGAGKVAP
jgi:(E)-4-hydroxy-3-methylbut-2-enyl-diphosphate synthase